MLVDASIKNVIEGILKDKSWAPRHKLIMQSLDCHVNTSRDRPYSLLRQNKGNIVKSTLDMSRRQESELSLCWGGALITRRKLLQLALAAPPLIAITATAISCSRGIKQEIARIPEGVWSKEEVIAFAQSMIQENTLNDVAYAGQILQGNQEDKPTFSEQCPIYTDEPIVFETTSDRLIPGFNADDAPAAAVFDDVGEEVEVVLNSKSQLPTQKFFSRTRTRMGKIVLSKPGLAGLSPLGIKFVVAKEIYNLRADQMLIERELPTLAPYFVLPSEPKQLAALKVRMRHQNVIIRGTEVPMTFAGDIQAHYLLVPNYLVAKEAGRFNTADQEVSVVYDQAGDYFMSQRILYKKNGKYRWSQDERTFVVWLDGILSVYQQTR